MTLSTVVFPIAGQGTRLQKLSSVCHKSLLEVDGKPLLEHAIENAIALNFQRFIFIVGHLKDQVEQFLEEKYPSLNKEIFFQEERKGLVHALSLAQSKIANSFFAVYCPDNYFLSLFDLKRAVKFHHETESAVVLIKREAFEDQTRACVHIHEKELFEGRPIQVKNVSLERNGFWQSTGFSIENKNFFSSIDHTPLKEGEMRIASIWERQLEQGKPIFAAACMGKILDITSENDLLMAQSRKKRKGVCCLLKDTQDQIILIKRDKKSWIPYPGYWSLCGGGIEALETPFEAMKRELLEELGLKVQVDDLKLIDQKLINDIHEHLFLLEDQLDVDTLQLLEGEQLGAFSSKLLPSLNIRDDEKLWLNEVFELAAH